MMAKPRDKNEATRPDTERTNDRPCFDLRYAAFLVAIQSLQDLLETENELLRQGRRDDLAGHQDGKETLSAELRTLMAGLLETPQFLQGPQNPASTLLIERVKVVQRLLNDNRMLLNAAKVATFRRIEAAVEAHRRQFVRGRGYGGTGGAEDVTVGPAPSAVLNREI